MGMNRIRRCGALHVQMVIVSYVARPFQQAAAGELCRVVVVETSQVVAGLQYHYHFDFVPNRINHFFVPAGIAAIIVSGLK